MTTPKLVDEGNLPKVPTAWTNDAVISASEALTALSKIGTKSKDMVKRLAKLIMWTKATTQEFFLQRDVLINTWAERDEAGEIKIIRSPEGNQAPVMRNGIEQSLAINELLRGPATFTGDPPEPLTEADLDKLMRWPDASVIAQLGPFVSI